MNSKTFINYNTIALSDIKPVNSVEKTKCTIWVTSNKIFQSTTLVVTITTAMNNEQGTCIFNYVSSINISVFGKSFLNATGIFLITTSLLGINDIWPKL